MGDYCESCLMRCCGTIMYFVVVGIILSNSYIVLFLSLQMDNVIRAAITSIVALALHSVILWCYITACVTNAGSVPLDWDPSTPGSGLSEHNQYAYSQAKRANNRKLWCFKCDRPKPPRAHHCSICQRCILKMDHHCPWFNNCIGFKTYKYFILFLFWVLIAICWILVSLGDIIWDKFHQTSANSGPPESGVLILAITLLVDCLLFLIVVGFLAMHIRLLLSNRTTLESLMHEDSSIVDRTTRRWMYNLSNYQNFIQVMGADRAYWLLPLHATVGGGSDGLTYPTWDDTVLFAANANESDSDIELGPIPHPVSSVTLSDDDTDSAAEQHHNSVYRGAAILVS